MTHDENFLECCLFFNTNALSRYLLKLAEIEFKHLNLSPAHASLMLMVYDSPGITPKVLSHKLHLTPSTITRFIDALEKKGLVKRTHRGKAVFVSSSRKGSNLKRPIAMAYKNLCLAYTKILGQGVAERLSRDILNASTELANYFDRNE